MRFADLSLSAIAQKSSSTYTLLSLCFTQLDQNDKLPKTICKECAFKLDEYYSYRESCIQSELILLKCLNNSEDQQSISKVRMRR